MTTPLYVEDIPTLSPGQCRRCFATGDRKWFLNMGYTEEFYGNVYYCSDCIAEMSNFIETATRLPRIYELREALKEANDRNSNLVGLYDRLLDSGIDLYALADFLAASADERGTPEREAALDRREKRLIKSDSERGPDDVPSAERNQLALKFGK